MKTRLISLFLVAALLPLAAQQATPATKKSPTDGIASLLGGERPQGATTEISADKQASFDNANNVAEFKGNVSVKDPQFTLECEKLRVTLNANRRGLATVEAEGSVVIMQDGKSDNGQPTRSIGRAKKIIYDAVTGRATLTGWPQVQHGMNTQVATEEGTVMILDRNGKSTTTGGSRTVVGETSSQ